MAEAGLSLALMAPFDPVSDPTSLGQRWKAWKKRFETYVAALNITNQQRKRAILLYQIGKATQAIFDTLTETGDDYDTAIAKLDQYFSPKKNVDFEIFKFRTATQNTEESIDQYATRLRQLAQNCEFTNVDGELKATIIQNCSSKRLRRLALRDDLTLENLLKKGRSIEASEAQASGMEQLSAAVNKVKLDRSRPPRKSTTQPKGPRQTTIHSSRPQTQCRKCGLIWPHKDGLCPAQGKTCKKCGKPNHFARACLSKTTVARNKHIRQVATKGETAAPTVDSAESSSEDEYLYVLGNKTPSKAPMVTVGVNDTPIEMMIDTGASANIIDENSFSQLQRHCKTLLKTPTKRIFAYGSDSQLSVLGQFTARISARAKKVTSTIYVLEGSHGSLLSCDTAQALDLIDIKVNQVDTYHVSNELIVQYPQLFHGIGKLKNAEVQLHIDPTVVPTVQSARRIPFHLRRQVSEELDNLEQQGIIEKVDGATTWASPLVIIPKKNGNVRLCVDMRMPNKAIKRERHQSPTVDDLIHNLNGATVFSKLDLKAGYHQIPLAEESRHITTFVTHKGLRRYTRLNFGTNSASEMFQNIISNQLRDIPGTLNISDDVIVYGKTQSEHDTALRKVFKRFAEINLTLNKTKCEFNKSSLSFFGFVFSKDGISPDPDKVQAIHNMAPPKSASEVRSFLGMATYCAKFIPSFSEITYPLRNLIKKDVSFQWTTEHQESFDKIKEMLTSETTMAYFDPVKETELTTDASPYGLSAILSQKTSGRNDRKIVAYVSCSLSDVERRYSQTEKEALAIVWAVERLHLYLYGKRFILHTDCKPVELIFNNPKSKPPARIERWNLRLQGYEFQAIHTKGSQNPSDFLSRHTTLREPSREETMAEEYVNHLSLHATPKAMALTELQDATKVDPTLSKLITVIQSGKWHEAKSENIKPFAKIRNELTVTADSNLILRGSRIVIPVSLQQRAIDLAHESHQGMVKTKQLLREKVWFPGIEAKVRKTIESCIACQANSSTPSPAPLKMSTLPPKPWHTVHVDFCGPFPTGEYLLVAVDAYSRFPEVEIVRSTTSKETTTKLDKIFSTHGIPKVVKSDNGPPFFSKEFAEFVRERGIRHQRSTPLWPQGNAEVERFMKPLTKAIRSVYAEGRDWKKDMYQFLLNYRATPHSTTEIAPAQLLFNRKITTKLPEIAVPDDNTQDAVVRIKDQTAKEKMKKRADRRAHCQQSMIQIGDTVLVKQKKKNKFTTKFDPVPYKVIEIKGSMITAVCEGGSITRNCSHFRRIQPNIKTPQADEESDDDHDDETVSVPQQVIQQPQIPEQPQRQNPSRLRRRCQRYGQNIFDT